jgi:hypothetical protein
MPAISAQIDELKRRNGSLAPKSIPSNAHPVTVAESALPEVTSATLKGSVQPAPEVALPAAQKNSEPSEKERAIKRRQQEVRFNEEEWLSR